MRLSKSYISAIILFISLFTISCSEHVHYKMEEVASSDLLWTGIAATNNGRMFVNYPRWIQNIISSVAEIKSDGNIVPYPDETWNFFDGETAAENHFVCVQSVYTDANGYLWILDAGTYLRSGIIENGPKLVKIDINNNEVIDKILFSQNVVPQSSYLNDVRIDVVRNYAFITDSGLGALIVANLDTKQSRRLLAEHKSTKAEDVVITIHDVEWMQRDSTRPKVHSDGIALDKNNEFIYYQALTGHTLYRIPVALLEDFSLPESEIEKGIEVYKTPGPADGIMFDYKGNLYLSSLNEGAIRYLDHNGEINIAVKSNSLEWPDSFSITKKGEIYFTDSKLNRAYQQGVKYKIYKLTGI